MDTIKINPSGLSGDIKVPPSKSLSHRAIICAGLSEGTSIISNLTLSEDIEATLAAITNFGARVKYVKDRNSENLFSLYIKGNPRPRAQSTFMFCGESGSTLRFLIPFAGLTGQELIFTGKEGLSRRPLGVYYEIFGSQGIEYSNEEGKLPLRIKGSLRPGTFKVRGDVSSQFITGLMFVLPLLKGPSVIEVTTPLQSKGYTTLTLDMLQRFGVYIEEDGLGNFHIKGNQKYKSRDYSVEGDYSQAAFWVVAGLLGGEIKLRGMGPNSAQGDRAILDIAQKMGGSIEKGQDFIKVGPGPTHGIEVDASQCPDLVPILAVLGALSTGTTRIVNAKRSRFKESDRLRAISSELNKLDAAVTELKEGLLIEGKEKLKGGEVHGWNDHRIVMALAIASIKCREPVIITGGDAVKKSYPHFWNDFASIGGKFHK